MDNNKVKHLDMIENIIERMAKNSFTLKEWTMALVALIGTFASQESERKFMLIAFVPICIFWLLDTYYLQLERKYRILYKNVAAKNNADIDFNLDIEHITVSGSDTKKLCYFNCLFSFTELIFYLPITLAMIILVIILKVV